MKRNYVLRFSIALLFFVTILLLRFLGIGEYLNLDFVASKQGAVAEFIANHYAPSVAIYMSIYIIIVFFMLPITLVLNIAAGYFYGVCAGTLFSVISATVGALFSLLAFRYLIGDWVLDNYGQKLERFNANFRKYGINYLLSLQLLPVTPFPVINVCAGLSGISVWTFFWTTAVGITPGTIIYTFAGRQLSHITSVKDILGWQSILLLLMLSFMALLPLIIKKLKNVRGS